MKQTICDNLKKIKNETPGNVLLVAVSKTKPNSDIMSAYACDQRDFGENKVQELVAKHEQLPQDIRWHMIGHLQRNKVKYIAPFVFLIHSVDNLKLLKEIEKQAAKHQRQLQVLLQIKIAKEDTKFGMDEETLHTIITQYQAGEFPNVRIKGLMGMATNTDDTIQIASEFAYLHRLYIKSKSQLKEMEYLSMGMSHDYKIAITHGSNLIRVGSAIFGARNYSI